MTLDNKQFTHLNAAVSSIPGWLIAGDYLLIAFAIYLLSFDFYIIKLLGFLLILRQQLALSVMMHEGVHYCLSKNKRMNDFIGVFLCSGPILSHFNAYRMLHMKHHRHTLTAQDPGQYLLSPQKSKKTLILAVLRDLSGITYFSLGGKASIGRMSLRTILINFAGQVFGLALVWLIFKFFQLSVVDFLMFWILPLVTLHQVILRIRALMEHGGFSYDKDITLCTRSVKPGILTNLVAPHNINFHTEHHLYPTIPSYRLNKVAELIQISKDENYIKTAHFLFHKRYSK